MVFNLKSKFKLYKKITENSFLSLNSYKIATLSKILFNVLLFTIQIYIWKAVFQDKDSVITNSGAIGIQEMINYVFFSTCISIFVNFEASIIYKIGRKINDGSISMDLIKPYNIRQYMLYQYVGHTLYRFIYNLIPIIFVAFLFFNVKINASFEQCILFSISVLSSCLLYFFITYTIGLLAFWYEKIGNLNILIDSSITLFSGAIIPFWFIPGNWQIIMNYLPFKYLFFSPISIILNKFDINQSINVIFIQILWILGFYLLSRIIYKIGIRKVTIQGG